MWNICIEQYVYGCSSYNLSGDLFCSQIPSCPSCMTVSFFYIIIVVAICPQVAFCFGLGLLSELLFCILLEDIL